MKGSHYSHSLTQLKTWFFAIGIVFILMILGIFFLSYFFCSAYAAPSVRIKDIVDVEGVRENQLVGYGIVVGLNGTGDTLSSSLFTKESLISMLERLGVNVRDSAAAINGKNVAAVMVTATLPPFARQGSRIDITVSTLGDAKDLRGGTLLVTPLMGADGDVYAVAQGAVSVNGFQAQGAATPNTGNAQSSVTKGVPTSARIANGAIIEKEINFDLSSLHTIRLSLRNPDFTTARRLAEAIVHHFHGPIAQAKDPTTVVIELPEKYRQDIVHFITDMEQLRLEPDQPAKIIIDDQDGVIVIGENVRVSTVAVTHGSITIQISESPQVSQPSPFTQVAQATVVNRTDIKATEKKGKFAIMPSGVSLQELVNGLNALGATPRDMITILQNIKAAGALQADIEVR